MRNVFTAVSMSVAAGALVLGACSSDSGSSGASGTSSTSKSGQVVSIKRVDGVGRVLVDPAGKTLYASDEEKDGTVRCTGACTSFWTPLKVSSASPKGPADAGRLGVVTRDDGSKQLTVDGKPVYSFSQDGSGQAKGNGFSDAFGSQHFTWHAVVAGGRSSTPTTSSGSGSSGGGSYGY